MKRQISLIMSIVFFSVSAGFSAEVTFPVVPIHVQTSEMTIRLNVAMATTPTQLMQGLMFRDSLASWDGMLFDFGKEQTAQMWMKNTRISLDMVFFNASQRVVHIARGAVPYSLDVIVSPEKARYVLELAHGAADGYHLKTGDRFAFDVPK